MKKIFLILLLASGLYIKGFAQTTVADIQKMSVAKKTDFFTDSMKIILNLNNDQYTKVHAILFDAISKAQPVIKNSSNRFSKGMQLKNILDDTEQKLKTVLSAKQQALYEIKKKSTIAYYRQQVKDEPIILDPKGK